MHRLTLNRMLILGGVQINHPLGLLGHSDADVLVHAIMDALLGAAGLGDIGAHFPDSDAAYKDANSINLLRQVVNLLNKHGYAVNNIDCTILAQEPKLQSYISQMANNIANAVNITNDKINIKATTEEGLGFTGEKLGIAAHAVCTVISNI